jgi:S-adenosylmethionine:tRNA ribosyltransferase-isomerase
MKAAHLPVQRHALSKLLIIDKRGHLLHWPRSRLIELFRRGDLVIANDAATLPAIIAGKHSRTGDVVEVRLAGLASLTSDAIVRPIAVVFGEGDFRMRTEDRPMPPELNAGDRLELGPLRATIETVLGHPRLVRLVFEGSPKEIWEGIARHGHPIQYSHVAEPLALWDVWTPIAGPPVALEPPSAGFVLDWQTVTSLNEVGVQFATITHAAGISSTGDFELDALLPFDEPYYIPTSTALAACRARARNSRIIAIGTTVVRALEDSAALGGFVRSGAGVATRRIGPTSRLRVVDALLSGAHEPGTSHHELLRAFLDDEAIARMDREVNSHDYRTHEFGDSVFVEKSTLKSHQIGSFAIQPFSCRAKAAQAQQLSPIKHTTSAGDPGSKYA